MKIGIIVYSKTGNTHSVALNAKQDLESKGHEVTIERITAEDPATPKDTNIKITNTPDPGPYEGIILGAPVQAFSLCAVMGAYLNQMPSLDGKRVSCFVTKQIPNAWTGGNGALKKMTRICTAKGGEVIETGIVFWKDTKRQESLNSVLRSLAAAY